MWSKKGLFLGVGWVLMGVLVEDLVRLDLRREVVWTGDATLFFAIVLTSQLSKLVGLQHTLWKGQLTAVERW